MEKKLSRKQWILEAVRIFGISIRDAIKWRNQHEERQRLKVFERLTIN